MLAPTSPAAERHATFHAISHVKRRTRQQQAQQRAQPHSHIQLPQVTALDVPAIFRRRWPCTTRHRHAQVCVLDILGPAGSPPEDTDKTGFVEGHTLLPVALRKPPPEVEKEEGRRARTAGTLTY
jgi:hypothetical protein